MHYFKRPGNLLLIVILAAFTGAALWNAGTHPWTAGPAPLLNFLGRLTGVLGMVMLLLAAAVSIRVPRLDQPFGGITELWKVHHVLGAASFVLLMLHPILLALARANVSPKAAAAVLLPPMDATATWLGWAALIAMMIFLAPTFFFFGPPKYQRWKALHAISAAAVILAIAHTVMLARTIPLWAWWTISIVALAALAFRLAYRKLKPGRRFTVTEVAKLTDGVIEIALVPEAGPPFTYLPGQFIYLAPLDPGIKAGFREEHPYTISSAPDEPHVRTAIKDLGDASGAIQHIATGAAAFIDGPYGRFFEPGAHGPELWIGGGIGITPFVGRARALKPDTPNQDIYLVYCTNSPDRAYYLPELEAIAARIPGFHVLAHYYYQDGSLSREWLGQRMPPIANREVYICGPAPLIDVSRKICRNEGVPNRRIHSEAFTFL